jgi:hypothetical protein
MVRLAFFTLTKQLWLTWLQKKARFAASMNAQLESAFSQITFRMARPTSEEEKQ